MPKPLRTYACVDCRLVSWSGARSTIFAFPPPFDVVCWFAAYIHGVLRVLRLTLWSVCICILSFRGIICSGGLPSMPERLRRLSTFRAPSLATTRFLITRFRWAPHVVPVCMHSLAAFVFCFGRVGVATRLLCVNSGRVPFGVATGPTASPLRPRQTVAIAAFLVPAPLRYGYKLFFTVLFFKRQKSDGHPWHQPEVAIMPHDPPLVTCAHAPKSSRTARVF